MDKKSESKKRESILEGIELPELNKHLEYFENNPEVRKLTITLPFGFSRELPTKNEKGLLDWRPSPKTMNKVSNDFERKDIKETVLVMWNDPSKRNLVYLEQDLMAKLAFEEKTLQKKTGYIYSGGDHNVKIRKHIIPPFDDKFEEILVEFINEVNRVYLMYCDVK